MHEAIEKADGVVFRCTLSGSEADRGLEIPAWMFDRTVCPDQPPLMEAPFVSMGALAALSTLLDLAVERWGGIIECPAFRRIQNLSRPESGKGSCQAKQLRQ